MESSSLTVSFTVAPFLVFATVTLPDGVVAGQTIHVQAPDGRLNAIVVPPGFGPGSTFTVEFAPDGAAPPPPGKGEEYYSAPPMAPAATAYNSPPQPSDPMAQPAGYGNGGGTNPNYTIPANPDRPDDGFASGFGR